MVCQPEVCMMLGSKHPCPSSGVEILSVTIIIHLKCFRLPTSLCPRTPILLRIWHESWALPSDWGLRYFGKFCLAVIQKNKIMKMLNEEQMLTPSYFFLNDYYNSKRSIWFIKHVKNYTWQIWQKLLEETRIKNKKNLTIPKKYLFLKLSFRNQIKHAEKLCSQLQSS